MHKYAKFPIEDLDKTPYEVARTKEHTFEFIQEII